MGICDNKFNLQIALQGKTAATTCEWIMEKRKITRGFFPSLSTHLISVFIFFFPVNQQKKFKAWELSEVLSCSIWNNKRHNMETMAISFLLNPLSELIGIRIGFQTFELNFLTAHFPLIVQSWQMENGIRKRSVEIIQAWGVLYLLLVRCLPLPCLYYTIIQFWWGFCLIHLPDQRIK